MRKNSKIEGDKMEHILEVVLNNFVFPVFIQNLDGKIIYTNERYADLHNKTPNELIGLSVEDIYPPEKWDMCKGHMREAVETGNVAIRDMYVENEYRQCSVMPIKDEKGTILFLVGVIGILNDIGKIRQQEHEIELQKNITRQMIDVLPGVIFYKDMKNRYVYANRECRDFFSERGVDNIFGKTDMEINPNKIQVEKFMRDDKLIMETKTPLHSETIFKDRSGNKSYKENVKIPLFDSNGVMTGIVGRSLDITERKLYQERLEYLSYTDILTGVKNRTYFQERDIEYSKEEYLPLGLIMGDANGLKLINDTFGHNEGDRFLKGLADAIKKACPDKGEVFRIGGDEFTILLPNSSLEECDNIMNCIREECEKFDNQLFNLSISLGAAIKGIGKTDIYDILKEAEFKVYREKLIYNKTIKASILNSLKIGLGIRSGETEEHTQRVVKSAIKIGKAMGLNDTELNELEIAADLHDIGKIGIDESILLKPGPLTDEEYEIMKTHTEKGYRIVKAASQMKTVAESVLCHHERWDGNGYPIGNSKEEIPLMARIISVCDSYDVMTHDRVYKTSMDKYKAIEELKRCSGTQFDPDVVNKFIELYSKGVLSDG